MKFSKALIGLSLVAVVAASIAGLAYAIPGGPAATTPGLVITYSDFATVLLSSRKTEASLVRAVCNDAYHTGMRHLALASLSLGGGNNEEAAVHVEMAATAVAMIATEGDKAIAAVRNRLLEGGHYHHARADVAEKYDPGYVVIDRAEKKKLLDEAGALGRLAQVVRAGSASPEAIGGAGRHLTELLMESVK